MARWMRLILADGAFDGRQVIDARALAPALTPQMTSSPPATLSSRAGSYGYGMNIQFDETGRVRFSHSGAFSLGAATTFAMSPAENLGIVVLTNGMPIGMPEAVVQSFFDVVATGRVQRDWLELFAELIGQPDEPVVQEPPVDPAPRPPVGALTGTYANPYYGPADVIANNGEISIVLGPLRRVFPLTHWGGGTFFYRPGPPTGEVVTPASAVTFELGPDGTAVAFTFEEIDDGVGTFTR